MPFSKAIGSNTASSNGSAHRKIAVSGWVPLSRKTLRGRFTIELPSGLVIHKVMLHESEAGSRWVAFPAQEWIDKNGKKQFDPFIATRDRTTWDRLKDAILEALDEYLAEAE